MFDLPNWIIWLLYYSSMWAMGCNYVLAKLAEEKAALKYGNS